VAGPLSTRHAGEVSSQSYELRRTKRGQRLPADWVRVTRGAARSADCDDEFRATLRALQMVLPGDVHFTHLTAARLREWWLPPLPERLPLFVSSGRRTRIRRPNLVAIRKSEPGNVTKIDGVRVASPAAVLTDCARDLSVLDLTCLIDSARRSRDLADEEVAGLGGRHRGGRALALAASRSDHRAESVYEVLLRELHRCVDAATIPQFEVTDAEGNFVARGDLFLVGTQDLHEMDGSGHFERSQYRKDRKRERRLGHADWKRRGYTSDDVLHQAITILRDIDVALGRPHDPSRIREWHELLRQSCFTPAGVTRLSERLGPASGQSEAC
jgi:hypothetical protein